MGALGAKFLLEFGKENHHSVALAFGQKAGDPVGGPQCAHAFLIIGKSKLVKIMLVGFSGVFGFLIHHNFS